MCNSPVQFKMVFTSSEKPFCAPPHLSDDSFPSVSFETVPMLVCNCWWPFFTRNPSNSKCTKQEDNSFGMPHLLHGFIHINILLNRNLKRSQRKTTTCSPPQKKKKIKKSVRQTIVQACVHACAFVCTYTYTYACTHTDIQTHTCLNQCSF